MAKKMQTKSVRVIALLLALIMIGSTLAMLPGGNNSTPKREVDYSYNGLQKLVDILPSGARQVVYINTANLDDEALLSYANNVTRKNLYSSVFNKLELQELKGILIAGYSNGFLYLVDANQTKVYYSGQEGNYSGFNVKTNNGIMMTKEVSPLLIGTQPQVESALNSIPVKNESKYSDYISRVPGEFNVVFMFPGESAQRLMGSNFTNYTDFYMEGIRTNDSTYEKVVAMHFKSSRGGFIDSNITDYYSYTNYEDNFSTVTMRDSNFTKILQAQPKLKPIIQFEQVKSKK